MLIVKEPTEKFNTEEIRRGTWSMRSIKHGRMEKKGLLQQQVKMK